MSDDRTMEFMSLARGLKVRPTRAAPAPPPPSSSSDAQAMADLRGFHKTAAMLSKDIAATSAMLGELARLVKQKSLFLDDSHKVNQLVVQIKSNIENLNGRLEEAAQQMERQKRQLGKNSQAGQEASNVVGQLQQEFVQATAGFKKVLQERTDSLKDQTQQKQQVYGSAGHKSAPASYGNAGGADPGRVSLENKPPVYESSAASSMASFPTLDLTSGYNTMSPGEPTSSHLPRPHGARGDGGGSYMMTPSMRSDSLPTYSGGTSSIYGTSRPPLTPLDIARMEQESGQDQMMQLIPDQDYLRERADAMETVETNIVELGKVFNKLAVMVSEHREMVRRVEDNVDDANTNISLSMETLTNTLTNLRTNKALFLKVFTVLVIFIILFITFFA